MAVGVFMESGKLLIQFPVNPEGLNLEIEGNNETTEVVKLGEINIAKDVKLATVELESFLPNQNNYPFILTKNDFKGPQFYIDFITDIRNKKIPIRFVVSDTNINMLALVESFSYGYKAGDDDVYFTLSLKEYREVKVKEVKISDYESNRPQKQHDSSSRLPSTNSSVIPGCTAIVNGRLHRDSYGKGPGMTLKNYKGKINFVKTDGRSHPYHVTDMNGGYMGWVVKDAVQVT